MNRLLCFDIDGTLISSNGAGGRSFKKAVQNLFGKEPDWKAISMAGQLDPGIFNNILNLIRIPFSEDIWQEFKALYLQNMEVEIKNPKDWIVFEGVREILERTVTQPIKPILMTGNIREGAQLKLKAVGLDQYFNWENSVFGEDGKLKRDELSLAFAKKNPHIRKAVVIGDTPDDIRLARLLKGVAIAVSTGVHSREELEKHAPDYLLENFLQFPSLFFQDPACPNVPVYS
jgi:phosphoglycolate phosphatase-like HAD superfamily hydrolase